MIQLQHVRKQINLNTTKAIKITLTHDKHIMQQYQQHGLGNSHLCYQLEKKFSAVLLECHK